MAALLSGFLGWLLRNLAALVLIMLVLYGGSLLVGEWRRSAAEVTRAQDSIEGLEQSRDALDQLAVQGARQLDDRLALLKQGPGWAIESRRAAVERELTASRADRRSDGLRALSLVTGNRDEIVADVQRDMRIGLLEHELASLRQLDHERSLEELRRRHAAAYAALTAGTPGGGKIWCPADPDSWRARTEARWSPGGMRRLELCRENRRAFEAWRSLRNDGSTLRTSQATAIAVARAAAGPVEQQLDVARAAVARRSSGVLHQIMGFLPAALGILAAALLVPPAIKALLFFVVAPIASRRPPIRILANPGGAVADPPGLSAGVQPVSSVSREVMIPPGHELLVHADYLQSSSTGGTKDTKWLLNAGYPIASIAAGMTVLTRIRPQVSEQVVLSSTTDPFSELGIVELQEGSAMVLQPHNLVGVLQLRDRPVKITSHWRLGSLTAWLTLQLRYLVFHGPGALVIKGCRGIRVESADSGRMINQAATIGFSAHLAYSTVRTETFAAYLLGRQELFNDRFAGGPGIYVYQEMPHFGEKAGITGRGLNGLLDSMMKVFGI